MLRSRSSYHQIINGIHITVLHVSDLSLDNAPCNLELCHGILVEMKQFDLECTIKYTDCFASQGIKNLFAIKINIYSSNRYTRHIIIVFFKHHLFANLYGLKLVINIYIPMYKGLYMDL